MSVPDLALNRLKRDYTQLITEPIDNVWAHPLEEDILKWHYVIRGPADTPFAGGLYHGKLLFPNDYPLKAPSIYMLTPNGKFSTNCPICVAGISDLHPERWSALQTVSSVLISLFSFMIDEKSGFFSGMVGNPLLMLANRSPDGYRKYNAIEIKELAKKSVAFNLNDQIFCKYFPQLAEESKRLNAQNI